MLDPVRPYNELPPLPPKADVETRAILKKWVWLERLLPKCGSPVPSSLIQPS